MINLGLRRPARYIDHELNAVKKKGEGFLLFTLCYPDLYEIGVSNTGIQILYHVLNSIPYVKCERVFLPYLDLEGELLRRNLPLVTLESKTPVKNSDILGISVQHELTYTNILTILHLSGIPLTKEKRKEDDPIVIAGGPCTLNPQPLMPFFDALFVGEGEEAVVEMAEVVRAARENGLKREEIVEKLSKIEGVLVEGKRTKRRIVKNLDKAPFPSSPLVPLTQSVQGRATVEIARGCPNSCRFCQAGFTYRPFRVRSVKTVMDLAGEILRSTGYDELSLLSLSTSDYPYLKELLEEVSKLVEREKVLLSLPSIRVGSITEDIIRAFGRFKKPTITLAPESGSERVLKTINKNIDLDLLIKDVEALLKNGWRRVKLYFLLGVPGESEEDLLDTVKLLRELSRISRRRNSIHASFSIFTPKPFTPFERAPQDGLRELQEKISLLKESLKGVRVSFSLPDPFRTKVEAILSRGGSETSELILRAWEMGARMDGWNELFRKDIWFRLLSPEDMDNLTGGGDAPWWNMVDPLIERSFVEREWELSKKGDTSPNCLELCTGCGACEKKVKKISFGPGEKGPFIQRGSNQTTNQPPFETTLYYSKLHTARYLSHLDLYNLIIKILRISKAPVWYSQGFHPNPAVSFPIAYPLGIEVLWEPFTLKLQENLSEDHIAFLNELIPEGLGIRVSSGRKGTPIPQSPGFDNYILISENELQGFREISPEAVPCEVGIREGELVYLLEIESGRSVTTVVGREWYKLIKRIVRV